MWQDCLFHWIGVSWWSSLSQEVLQMQPLQWTSCGACSIHLSFSFLSSCLLFCSCCLCKNWWLWSLTRINESDPPLNFSYRWAAIPQSMEFYIANLITTSSSRRLPILPRSSNPVRSHSLFSFFQFFHLLLELVFHGEGCTPYFIFSSSANTVFLHSVC